MIPQITWGAAFVNSLVIEYPLDNPVSYSEDKPGSSTTLGQNAAASWLTGVDYYLEGDIRHIATNHGPSVRGWDGATGWGAFLEWARDAENLFRWIPDQDVPGTFVTARLIEPRSGPPALENSFRRTLHLKIQSTDGSAFTGY